MEGQPLLSNSPKSVYGRSVALALLSLIAVAAVSTSVVFYRSGYSVLETYDLPDGVEPVDKLSFTQAEAIHNSGAKKLDDVASRQELRSYFDKIGSQYKEEAEAQKQLRAGRHPGQLSSPSLYNTMMSNIQAITYPKVKTHAEKVVDDLNSEKESVDKAVQQGIEAGTKTTTKAIKEPTFFAPKKHVVKAATHPKVAAKVPALAADGKVKVNFYMESMCPGCKYYTANVVSDLMNQPGFTAMVDLKVVPFGNGQVSGNNIVCQHGADECKGNKIIACMQSLYPVTESSKGFLPAFSCLEQHSGVPADGAEKCATDNGLDYASISSCVNGPDGDKLAMEAADDTNTLKPPHEYAPWITLNGKPLRDKAYDLKDEVCNAFQGVKTGTMCETVAARVQGSTKHQILAARPPNCYPTLRRVAKKIVHKVKLSPHHAVAPPAAAHHALMRKTGFASHHRHEAAVHPHPRPAVVTAAPHYRVAGAGMRKKPAAQVLRKPSHPVLAKRVQYKARQAKRWTKPYTHH